MVSYGATMMTVSIVPSLVALVFAFRGYRQYRYQHFLYMGLTWLALAIGNALLAYSYWTLNLTIYKIGVMLTVPVAYSIMALVDSISRADIDKGKLTVITVAASSVVWTSLESDAVRLNVSALGEIAPALSGNFLLAGSAVFAISGTLWFYYMLKIYLSSPENIRSYATLNLIAATIAGPGSALAFASGLVWIIPGTDYFLIGAGSLLCSLAFFKEPKLGYVLPFKVYDLVIIDLDGGLPIYAYRWDENAEFDYVLFSGALQGVAAILNESLMKGYVREIVFERGILLLHRSPDVQVGYVLITSATNAILNQSLQLFSSEFEKRFKETLKQNRNFLDRYASTDEILQLAFPYVVTSD